jgi:hypothetical protein
MNTMANRQCNSVRSPELLSCEDRRNRITAHSADQVKENALNGFVGTICAALISFLAFTLPAREPATRCSSIEPESTAARLTMLRRGINTSHWFAQVFDKQGYTKAHFDTHTTAEDIALIKAMGFDHIRFSVELAPMFNSEAPENLPTQYLGYVDHAIDMILADGLAVVVDIDPSDEFKKNLADDKRIEAFRKFWRAFAKHQGDNDDHDEQTRSYLENRRSISWGFPVSGDWLSRKRSAAGR